MAPLSIRFSFEGKRRSVRVYNESLQIRVLREKIGEKIEGEFELYFGGVKLDDNMTLLNYGIQHDSLIRVEKKYNLHVYPLESCYVVQVHDSMTVAEVKELLESTSGLDFSNRRLMLGLGQDRVVLNDESALGQSGIRESSHVAFESDSESDESHSDSDPDE